MDEHDFIGITSARSCAHMRAGRWRKHAPVEYQQMKRALSTALGKRDLIVASVAAVALILAASIALALDPMFQGPPRTGFVVAFGAIGIAAIFWRKTLRIGASTGDTLKSSVKATRNEPRSRSSGAAKAFASTG